MNAGDFASKIASNYLFPIINFEPPYSGWPNCKLYSNPYKQKIVYRNFSLDKLVLWEQWKFKEYRNIKVKQGDIVVEIGGHIGTSTLDYARLVGDSGKVYTFEPFFPNFQLLKENLRLNSINNASAYHLAIVGSNSVSEVNLGINPQNTGGHSLNDPNCVEKVRCKAISLPNFLSQNQISRIDILQIDAEGAEFDILLNLPKSFFDTLPQIVFEYHDLFGNGHQHFELLDLMHEMGYSTKIAHTLTSRVLNLQIGIIYASKSM